MQLRRLPVRAHAPLWRTVHLILDVNHWNNIIIMPESTRTTRKMSIYTYNIHSLHSNFGNTAAAFLRAYIGALFRHWPSLIAMADGDRISNEMPDWQCYRSTYQVIQPDCETYVYWHKQIDFAQTRYHATSYTCTMCAYMHRDSCGCQVLEIDIT